MKQLLVSVFVVAACAIVMVWTLPRQQQQSKRFGAYSLNLHFVPANHRGPCTTNLITPWFPNDTQCAQCYCIRSGFSRCIPRQGCRPTYTPATTLNPNATTQMNNVNDPLGSSTVAQSGSTSAPTPLNNASPSTVPSAAGSTSSTDRPGDSTTTDAAGGDTETTTTV